MARPVNKQEFIEYCLRKVGAPIFEINMSDEQIEDRVDEAISFWQDYFYDGSEHVYIKHELTQTDVDNGYVTVPARLLGVVRIFDISNVLTGTGMWNVQYQFALNNMHDIASYGIQNYWMSMQHIQFLNEWLVGTPQIRYNRHSNRVYLDISKNRLKVGSFIVIEAYDILDQDAYEDMWSDRWLQNYATTLIREQFGYNLTKFVGVQLIGGVTFNGEQILNDAREERKRLEEEAIRTLQPLTYNFCG